ncbi:hypothetical protein ACFFVB_08225 [Formosa undariae]|uniref:DUF1826 domain-containing protein n=1 Tax=Formosa undariae TaxID=1325436 RepID=A0ABV5F0U1_9FLAO
MENISHTLNQIQFVTNFQDFVSNAFHEKINAICWNRKLVGDFSEIVKKLELHENIAEIHPNDLLELQLSEQGQLAREVLLNDLKTLKALGASPTLNLINFYDRDDSYPFFPTDVYSFHVDQSPVPVDTFLCTYYGESSEILPNSQAKQKILVPEIRNELKKIYHGTEDGFKSFLSENFFDLHYLAKPEAQPIKLGLGHLYRLAIEHPQSKVLPSVHRAPKEKNGQKRLLLIC